MEENIFQTYITMVRQGLFEDRVEGTPLIIHHYTDSQGQNHGSFNKEKIEKMANGRELKQSHVSDYKGHLMGKEYN